MSRDFTKDLANYMSLGVGALSPLISGASVVSVGAFIAWDTVSAANAANNGILTAFLDSVTSGLLLNVDGTAGNTLRILGQAAFGEAAQVGHGGTTLVAGTVYHVGAVIDFAGDTITAYVNGVADGVTGVTFTASAYTPTGSYLLADVIGGTVVPASATANQFDGRLSEFALWASDIGSAGFAQVAACVSPLLVGAPVFYMRMLGDVSPEPALVSSVVGTITGSLPQAIHPCVTPSNVVPVRQRKTWWFALPA